MRAAAVSIRAASLVSMILLLPASAAAQEPVSSFDQLNVRLKAGDTVWVTDADGREVKGRIVSIAPASLSIDAGAVRTMNADEVRFVRNRRHDPLGNGAAYGAAAGAVTGIGLLLAACGSEGDCDTVGAAGWLIVGSLFGAAGAGVGVGIDALKPGPRQVVYRAPTSPGARSGGFAIGPMIGPRRTGVAVSFAF